MSDDKAAIRELKLYLDNDGELYQRHTVPTYKNLLRKMKSGKFDPAKSVKLWMYLVDAASKKYRKEFGSASPDARGGHAFDINVRRAVAQELALEFVGMVNRGEITSSTFR